MNEQVRLKAGPIVLDLGDESVWIDGAKAKLGAKALRLLGELMRSPKRLVAKEELIESVWDGRAVSDAVLTTAMRELRSALGDPARTPRFIETVHGRGYRFLLESEVWGVEPSAPVTLQPEPQEGLSEEAAEESPLGARSSTSPNVEAANVEEGAPTRRNRFQVAVVAFLGAGFLFVVAVFTGQAPDERATEQAMGNLQIASAAHPMTLAVLPFTEHSPSQADDWFAAGLTEELTATLVRSPDLRIVDVSNSVEVTNAEAAGAIGQSIGVAHVLVGSVRRADDRIRVSTRLIRSPNGETLWAETYDRDEAGVIEIQEDIAFEIARALRTVMDPEQLRAMVATGTRSVDAYEALLRGHHYLHRQYQTGDVGFQRKAYDAYERARTLDPGFAEAHWLAARYWLERATFIRPAGLVDEASAGAVNAQLTERLNAAINAAPDETSAKKYQAALHLVQSEYRASRAALEAYLEARPRDVFAWVQLARITSYLGDWARGREAAAQVAALSDETSPYFTQSVTIFNWVRDFEGGARQAEAALALSPDNAFIQYHAHRAFLLAGDVDSARPLLAQVEAGGLPTSNRLLARMRQACAEGDRQRAEATREEINSEPTASVTSRWLANMMLGEQRNAEALLSPYDRPEDLPRLAAWFMYPHFDESNFSNLSALLVADGIDRGGAVALPYACPIDSQASP